MSEQFDQYGRPMPISPQSQNSSYDPNSGQYTEFEGKFGNASARLKSYRFVDIMVGFIVFATAATLYISWEHKMDMRQGMIDLKLSEKESAKLIGEALKEQVKAVNEQTRAIHFQACILSVAQEKRSDAYTNEFSQCRQIRNF